MTVPPPAAAPGWGVLVVCTGNICRSPAAELLLRHHLRDAAGIRITSAGLEARVGEPVAEPMARLLRTRALDPTGWRARQLEPGMVGAAALVLTMTAEQRAAVVGQVPAAVRRTFTLLEFAALAGLVGADAAAVPPADRLAECLRSAPRARALRSAGPRDDDIEDPYRRDDAVFLRVLDRIDAATAALAAALRPPVVTPRGGGGR